MNCEIYDRFKEVIPVKRLDEMDLDDVFKSCRTAFEIIGYTANDLDRSIEEAWAYSSAESLFQFICDVYEVDTNGA